MISSLVQPFDGAPFDVGAGAGVDFHASQHDAPQGVVGLAVTGGVESLPDDLARRRRDRGDAAEVGPGRFAAEPVGVVAGGDQQDGGGVGADAVQGEEAGCAGSESAVRSGR